MNGRGYSWHGPCKIATSHSFCLRYEIVTGAVTISFFTNGMVMALRCRTTDQPSFNPEHGELLPMPRVVCHAYPVSYLGD
jgi:hypothetical protein